MCVRVCGCVCLLCVCGCVFRGVHVTVEVFLVSVKQPDEDNKEGVNETRKSGRKHRRKYGPLKDKEESPEGGGRYYSADASGEDTATEKRHRRRSKKEGKEGGGQPLYVSGDETQAYGADYTEDAEGMIHIFHHFEPPPPLLKHTHL